MVETLSGLGEDLQCGGHLVGTANRCDLFGGAHHACRGSSHVHKIIGSDEVLPWWGSGRVVFDDLAGLGEGEDVAPTIVAAGDESFSLRNENDLVFDAGNLDAAAASSLGDVAVAFFEYRG